LKFAALGVPEEIEMNPSKRRIRVVVADDSHSALYSICRYLDLDRQFEVVGTARDGLQLVKQVNRLRPDLVLTDLSMPLRNGLEVAMELRYSFPDLRLLIFSELEGMSLRDECLRFGADGFVEKAQMPEKLIREIHRLFPKRPDSD
jgi:DNA-binding NarL/FixJ family response regulator